MKKIFLLFMLLIMSCTVTYAVDWQAVDTNSANLNLYVDRDSVKNINPDEYVYAIKYRLASKPEQVAYIKSSFNNNYIGIIQTGLFDVSEYRPLAVFANPRAFMKPVNKDSFLNYAHNYVAELTSSSNVSTQNTETEKTKIEKVEQQFEQKPVLRESYQQKTLQEVKLAPKDMQEYMFITRQELEKNWNPPKSGRNTQAIVILKIGADGSHQNYKFAKSSDDKLTDRSIMSAIELSAPYARLPKSHGRVNNSTDVQFVFEYKLLKKSVI